MQVIPVSPIAAQRFAVVLGGQRCRITLQQKRVGMFMDLAVNDVPMLSGMLCVNGALMVLDPYRGFEGDLAFLDTEGDEAPQASGLGARWLLTYVEAPQILTAAQVAALPLPPEPGVLPVLAPPSLPGSGDPIVDSLGEDLVDATGEFVIGPPALPYLDTSFIVGTSEIS